MLPKAHRVLCRAVRLKNQGQKYQPNDLTQPWHSGHLLTCHAQPQCPPSALGAGATLATAHTRMLGQLVLKERIRHLVVFVDLHGLVKIDTAAIMQQHGAMLTLRDTLPHEVLYVLLQALNNSRGNCRNLPAAASLEVIVLKLCAETCEVTGTSEVDEGVPHVRIVLHIDWKVQEIITTRKPLCINLLEQMLLSVFVWDVSQHGRGCRIVAA